MAAKTYAVALTAGTLLSGAAAGAIGSLGPSGGFPTLSARHPLAAYVALGRAPTGSWTLTFAVSAVICFLCLLAAGLTERRRARAAQPPAASAETPGLDYGEERQPW